MTNFNDNMWYVWGASWDTRKNTPLNQGWKPDAVCETETEAQREASRLWVEELDTDEQVLIYHAGCIAEDCEWWGYDY